MTYREPDAERSRLAAQEREVASWLQTMEARRLRRARTVRHPVFAWVAVVAGPMAGLLAARAIGALLGVRDESLLLAGGAFAGFLGGVAVVIVRALWRGDGLRP